MRFFTRKAPQKPSPTMPQPAATVKLGERPPSRTELRTWKQIESSLSVSSQDISTGRYRVQLYRFLCRQVPLVSSVISTWARLAAARGRFEVAPETTGNHSEAAERRLLALADRLCTAGNRRPAGLGTFMAELATTLFRDGLYSGFVTVQPDGHAIDRFLPVDAELLEIDWEHRPPRLLLETDKSAVSLDRPDFYWMALDAGPENPFGRSILEAIPFVAYIEQQLVNDMRRSSHNAGYHRLHIKITPPERQSGESDTNYVDRINRYFDDTVKMIRSCDIDENPVTWDNIAIEHVGPSQGRTVVNSWFMHHRAMIEEICAGTNLAPFLMGYSYGATNTWSAFKFDMVMRQVCSVQESIASFMEWLGNIDLALGGFEPRCRFVFDNTLAYQAVEQAEIDNRRVENTIKLYESELISKEEARERISSVR